MTSDFGRALRRFQPRRPRDRAWIYVPYDQLSDRIGPLARTAADRVGIVIVENPWKASRRPYHQQKLALVLANGRQFALEQAARGVAVHHVIAEGPYRQALAAVAAELGPLTMMEAAERELRVDVQPLVDGGQLIVVPHEGWLTSHAEFTASQGAASTYRMDRFYAHVRKTHDILMDRGKPVGGRFSFDADNRQRWRGVPSAPRPPHFAPDAVTAEVANLIRQHFGRHPGQVDLTSLPTTADDALALWAWARHACLPSFGPFEDAMAAAEPGLFHTRIAPLVNLHRLLPRELVDDVLALELPLPSQEGFVRQVLGWREFVRHVHVATDGFRTLAPVAPRAGDGGWATWRGTAWPTPSPAPPAELDGGAAPLAETTQPLPPAFWGASSGLACLDQVVADVWRDAWSHHITRLMVLGNLATLLEVSPRQLTDWFWVAYQDAYDWVVEPNVLAMGRFGVDVMTTKPYIAGAAYLHRMGDYCSGCAFDPKTTCPITPLYWAYLDRHADALATNPRMIVPVAAVRKRTATQRQTAAATFTEVTATLGRGERLAPNPPSDGDRAPPAAASASRRRRPTKRS